MARVLENLDKDVNNKVLISKGQQAIFELIDDIARFYAKADLKTFYDVFMHAIRIVKISNLPLSVDSVKIVDADGVMADELDKILASEENVKLIYMIPSFQNPSGRTVSAERRKAIMEVVQKYDVILIEDAPYEDLKYTDDVYPCMKSMDTTGQVLYFGSFSKVITPGFRLGYSIASEPILSRMIIGKQSCDLNCSVFSQAVLAEFLKRGLLPDHLKKINAQYKAKRDLMLATLEEVMPEGVTWTHPEGGLFLWLELPSHMSTNDMFLAAVGKKVAYVAGDSFYAAGEPHNAMRINFSNATPDKIVQGVKSLAEVIKANM
jgi:2-aminoadipate transaminase